MQCVILAGGLATRMRPLTDAIPKALLPVAGRPFADLQLTWLAREGVTDIVYCVGHLGEMIEDYVGDGSQWGLAVRYVDDGPELRGTAGALRRAADAGVLDPAFLVVYGDSYLDVGLAAVWQRFEDSHAPALMTVLRNDGRWEASNVRFRDGQVEFYAKGARDAEALDLRYVDYGLLAIRRWLIEDRVSKDGSCDLAELQHSLSVAGELRGFEVFRRFFEIGSPSGLADLEAELGRAHGLTPRTPVKGGSGTDADVDL